MEKRCERCNGTFHVENHHIQPLATGGDDHSDNLISLCRVCHNEIHVDVTNANPVRFTGTEFEDWLQEDVPEQCWDTEYACAECGFRWIGKPILDRPWYNIRCARKSCSGVACIEVGRVLLEAYFLKKIIYYEPRSINYTSVEIDQAKSLDSTQWSMEVISYNDELPVYSNPRMKFPEGQRVIKRHRGRAPLGFKRENGWLVKAKNYNKVCTLLEKVKTGELTQAKAARELDTTPRTIGRAVQSRLELYEI